ncbi:MAG: hypothetical protein ACO32I_07150 [Candidatus Limnocylindrus sp.]
MADYPDDFRRYLLEEHQRWGNRERGEAFRGVQLHKVERADGHIVGLDFTSEFLGYLERAVKDMKRDQEWQHYASRYLRVEDAIHRMGSRNQDLLEVLRFYQVPSWLRKETAVALAGRLGWSPDTPARKLNRAVAAVWWEMGESW